MLEVDDDNTFLTQVCFLDAAIFHVTGKVNRHNCHISRLENSHVVIENWWDSPKRKVCCGIIHDRIISTYFFAEKTVTAFTYLDMLQLYSVPQLHNGTIYSKIGLHFTLLTYILRQTIPSKMDRKRSPYITWPARSPDLTPPDFFCGGMLRTRSTEHQYVIWQTYKKKFMVLSTMSHRRCFITHGSKFYTSWTFPVLLMKAMLSFIEHSVKNPSFHSV